MRPKRSILLMSDDKNELARLRFVVSTKLRYRVNDVNPMAVIVKLSSKCGHDAGCKLIAEAMKKTRDDGRFLPVLCEAPIALFESLRVAFEEQRQVSITEKRIESFERLDWVTKRRRGPRKKVRSVELGDVRPVERVA